MLYILPGNVHDFCLKARIDVNSCYNGDRLTEVAIGHWEKTLVIQKLLLNLIKKAKCKIAECIHKKLCMQLEV